MMSPSGIEIKVGQIWRGVGRWQNGGYDYTVKVIEAHRKCGLIKIECRHNDGRWCDVLQFHGKRGGYKLVKDVA